MGCVTGERLDSAGVSESAPSVSAYLDTLFYETLPICSKTVEQQKVANILLKYGDVSSSGDDDMGLTDLVQHSINYLFI